MTVRRLICVCGSSVALGLTSASAQNTTTTERQSGTLSNTPQAGSAENVDQILEQRQGVWRVDVMLNEAFWSKMGSGHSTTTTTTGVDQRYITPGERGLGGDTATKTTGQTGTQTGTQTNKPADTTHTEKDDPSNPWFKDSGENKQDAATTGRTGQSGQQAGQTGQTMTSQPGMKHLSGYAECDMVLGDDVLHERIVVPTAGEDLGIPSDGQQDTTPPSDMTGGEGFRGITMISFNQDSKTYDMVMLSNHYEGIKYDTGIYDAQRNRVVFRGQADKSSGSTGMSDPSRTTDWQTKPSDRPASDDAWRTDPSRDQPDSLRQDRELDRETDPSTDTLIDPDISPTDPSATRTQPLTDTYSKPMQRGFENVIVVLEVVDDNTQRVTMYDASGSMPSDITTTPDRWDRPATDNLDREDDLDTDLSDDLEDDLDDAADDLDDATDDLDDAADDDLDDDTLNDNLDDDADVGDDYDGRKNQDAPNKDQDALKTDPTVRTTPSTVTRTQPLTTAATGEFGRIIYQATYTRADSSMEASIRSMIDREIVVASR
ncbi:MAG TPA: hypothetical protein VFF69_10215 [Phycisphaerales bacterium]|nr:hypothetical protein [Phycisphaerales bacterium]